MNALTFIPQYENNNMVSLPVDFTDLLFKLCQKAVSVPFDKTGLENLSDEILEVVTVSKNADKLFDLLYNAPTYKYLEMKVRLGYELGDVVEALFYQSRLLDHWKLIADDDYPVIDNTEFDYGQFWFECTLNQTGTLSNPIQESFDILVLDLIANVLNRDFDDLQTAVDAYLDYCLNEYIDDFIYNLLVEHQKD